MVSFEIIELQKSYDGSSNEENGKGQKHPVKQYLDARGCRGKD